MELLGCAFSFSQICGEQPCPSLPSKNIHGYGRSRVHAEFPVKWAGKITANFAIQKYRYHPVFKSLQVGNELKKTYQKKNFDVASCCSCLHSAKTVLNTTSVLPSSTSVFFIDPIGGQQHPWVWYPYLWTATSVYIKITKLFLGMYYTMGLPSNNRL